MKRSLTALFALALCLVLASCEGETVTGSVDAKVLSGAQFTITERTLSGSQMIAKGTVKNNGKSTWSPVWVLEGQFYTDSTFTVKLGGATRRYTFSLEKGSSTIWELKLTSTLFNLSEYPNYGLKLRVIQE